MGKGDHESVGEPLRSSAQLLSLRPDREAVEPRRRLADPTRARARELAVRVVGLTKDFPSVRAVDKLNLEVPRGSIFGFLGPNGAGKTTMIRLLLGLLKPTQGSAYVMGFHCSTQSHDVRKRCGVLLEHSGLILRMSAEANLETFGRIWKIPAAVRRARIEELLTRLGLWERRSENVGKWSRGMKQKLAIARALVHRPAVIFLDEPTAGLDPLAAVELREDLLRLASQEHVTVFLNTHNLSEAERLCDLVGVIRQGRLLSVGTPAELRDRSIRSRVRFSGSGFSDNVVQLLEARREVARLAREGDNLFVDLRPGAVVADLVRFLVRLNVSVEEVTPVDNTLEEVFLSMVSGEVPTDGSWLVTEDYRSA